MQHCDQCDADGTVSDDHLVDFVEVCPDCGQTLRRRTAEE